MSYRSFKRVLGETNLERKCRFLFGGCLLLLITGSFFWYGRQTEDLVDEQNRLTGGLLVDTILTRVHFERGDAATGDRFLPEELTKQFSNYKYSYNFIKPYGSDDGSRPTDEYEWAVWDHFREDPAAAPLERRLSNVQEYQYFQAVRASTQSCVDCHRERLGFTGNVGDVIAVAKIAVPDAPTQRRLNLNRAVLLSTAIITVFLAMVASYVIVRYVIAKPLKHLKDVSDAISHGNIEKRAEIRTGDEFEELGRAFNRMLRHLVAIQEELRQVNADLDGKLDELAQANMALFEMNRLKSDFLATMSHELRTPLNSILGFSEVLGSIDLLDDKQKRYVKNIQKSGKMLLDMINDILDLAKIESGKMDVRLSDFRIDHVVHAQADLVRPLAERKNIDLEVEIEPNIPLLHQDHAKIQQILANLTSNAVKFTPEGGRIKISAGRTLDMNYLVLIVADTGVGIAEEDQEVIFEKFRQGNTMFPSGNAMTREYSGTGLGLSIVKELCKLLGGSVSLKSELGKGSTFTVRVPMVLPDQPRGEGPSMEQYVDFAKAKRVHVERRGALTGSSVATPRAD